VPGSVMTFSISPIRADLRGPVPPRRGTGGRSTRRRPYSAPTGQALTVA
jgi:hypothetical protein